MQGMVKRGFLALLSCHWHGREALGGQVAGLGPTAGSILNVWHSLRLVKLVDEARYSFWRRDPKKVFCLPQ